LHGFCTYPDNTVQILREIIMNFPDEMHDAVWSKKKRYGTTLLTDDENKGYDICGAEIHKDQYGKDGKYGWEIDHIKPKSAGGSDELSNLQPLQWENNRAKGEQRVDFNSKEWCVVRSTWHMTNIAYFDIFSGIDESDTPNDKESDDQDNTTVALFCFSVLVS